MNSKFIKNIIRIFVLIVFILNISIGFVNAGSGYGSSAIDEFKKDTADSTIVNTTVNVVGTVFNVVKIVSLGTAMCILLFLGIKYMVSSVEQKAEIKKYAVFYILGAIVMFGASGIISVIQTFSNMF